jgi:hypothetical protein
MQQMLCTPIFGVLGPKAPEAYCCLQKLSPDHVKGPATFVLGPYETNATCGFDYITKLGVKAATEFLERYRNKGNILFESIFTSVRILEPSVGRWIAANKSDFRILTLTTSLAECEADIAARKTRSVAGAHWNNKHLLAQQRMFERVTAQYEERGFAMQYVSRDEAPGAILDLLRKS